MYPLLQVILMLASLHLISTEAGTHFHSLATPNRDPWNSRPRPGRTLWAAAVVVVEPPQPLALMTENVCVPKAQGCPVAVWAAGSPMAVPADAPAAAA